MATTSSVKRKGASDEVRRNRSWILLKVMDKKTGKAISESRLKNFAENLQEKFENPKLKRRFYEDLFSKSRPNYRIGDLVIIRVEVVKVNNMMFNIIIPVDGRSQVEIDAFTQHLKRNKTYKIDVIEAKVAHHFPKAPYLANGYISNEEANIGGKIAPDTIGLTRTSPGDNPWG